MFVVDILRWAMRHAPLIIKFLLLKLLVILAVHAPELLSIVIAACTSPYSFYTVDFNFRH